MTPTATVLTTEYIHGAGQLLAERLPASQAPTASGLGAATGATDESFESKLDGAAYTSEVMVRPESCVVLAGESPCAFR